MNATSFRITARSLALLAFLSLTCRASTSFADPRAMSPQHPNAQLLRKFYDAFAVRDGKTMGTCYSDDVHFSDEVFPELHGARAKAMWRMLCERGTDLRIEASGFEANDTEGKAHWEAWYTFSKTGKKVHNIIDARFQFAGGVIVRHVDHFDFARWAKQALGAWGRFLGWTSFLKNKVRKQAALSLDEFLRENP